MADKISVEIGLDGGAEVDRQLAATGKAGQQMFSDIQSAANEVNLDSPIEQFDNLGDKGQAAFQKVQTAAKSAVAFEQIMQGVGKVEGAFNSLGEAVGRMATRMTRSLGIFGVLARSLGPVGIAVGAAAGAFLKFGDSAADSMNSLSREGAKLGLTAQQLDVFQKALTKLGIAPDVIIPGLQKLGEAFGGNLFQNMQAFIGQLEKMPDGVQRTQLAMQTLGEGLGSQVIAGLQTGAVSAQNFVQALSGVTGATQQQQVEAAKYQQALNQMSAAWNRLIAAVTTPIVTPVINFLIGQIDKLSADLLRLAEEIQVVIALWQLFNAPMDQQAAAAQRVKEAWDNLGNAARTAGQQAANGMNIANQATGNLINTTNTATGAQQTLMQAAIQAAQAEALAAQRLEQEVERIENAWRAVNGQASASLETMKAGLDQVESDARNAEKAIERIGGAWVDASGPGHGTPGAGSAGGEFSSGGFIGGRGTGSSDSNLAWVSRGEHIMPARAVRQPGVLAFLEALRRSGGNLRGLLDDMGHFARGGLVLPANAFAGGGLNRGGGSSARVLNLTIEGRSFAGLSVPESTAASLERFAVHSQIASTGRKPSWRR